MFKNTTHPFLKIIFSNKEYKKLAFGSTACSVLNKLFDIAPEILIGIAIDVVVSREKSFLAQFGVVDVMSQIWILGGLTLFIWIMESLFEYLLLLGWRNLAQNIQHDIRVEAYGHVQKLDVGYFEDKSTGNLVSILNDDINQLERFLNGGANNLIQIMTAVLAVGGVFFYVAPKVAVLAFLPIPIILWGAFYYQKRSATLYNAVREQAGFLSGLLANNISGIATIQSYTASERELNRLRNESQKYCEVNRRAIVVSSAFIPIIRMAILAGFLATLVYGGFLTISGELKVGSYGILVFLTQRLLWPLTTLAETVDLYQRSMASTKRVLDLLATPVKIANLLGAKRFSSLKGKIQFENVSFDYNERKDILKNINLNIPAHSIAAFVGPTGSGKSTLFKLLLRFYEPQKGRVLIDDHDIREFDLDYLRNSIGYISQDVFLFHGSVLENIRYGRPNANFEEIMNAAKLAEAHHFIQELPQGYETIVGERGQKLSGGQRQRISIARAVLKDPPILLMDEATSAVDNETEAAIQKSLRQLSLGRTTLVVAHRLSTIVHSTQIHVIDQGRLTDSGNHQELRIRKGLYQNLWEVQSGL